MSESEITDKYLYVADTVRGGGLA